MRAVHCTEANRVNSFAMKHRIIYKTYTERNKILKITFYICLFHHYYIYTSIIIHCRTNRQNAVKIEKVYVSVFLYAIVQTFNLDLCSGLSVSFVLYRFVSFVLYILLLIFIYRQFNI